MKCSDSKEEKRALEARKAQEKKIRDYAQLIQDVLEGLDVRCGIPNTPEANTLILMTVLHESGGLKFDRQVGGGPALGFVQMERATHKDIHVNYLQYRKRKRDAILRLIFLTTEQGQNDKFVPDPDWLIRSRYYAIAMCRMHYYRVPESIPTQCDKTVEEYYMELAAFCKKHYNRTGKATVQSYYDDFMLYKPRG